VPTRSGRAAYGMNCCDRGFESRSRHGCLYAFILCLCCPVCRFVALRQAGRSSKESYCPSKKDYETEEEATAQQRAAESLMNE
jgi:hypothetical protein